MKTLLAIFTFVVLAKAFGQVTDSSGSPVTDSSGTPITEGSGKSASRNGTVATVTVSDFYQTENSDGNRPCLNCVSKKPLVKGNGYVNLLPDDPEPVHGIVPTGTDSN